MRNLGLATIFAAASMVAFACGDDPSTSSSDNTSGGNTMNTGGDSTGGNGTGNTGNTGAGASGAAGGTGGAGTGGNGAGGNGSGGGIDPACDACVMGACPSEYAACQAEPGCEEIMACIYNSGCMGDDFGCLFAACGATANMYGGIQGPAAQAAIAVGQCLADPNNTAGQACVAMGGPCNP